jgi:hypothetical protein
MPRVSDLIFVYNEEFYNKRMKSAINEWAQIRKELMQKHDHNFIYDIKHPCNLEYYNAAKIEIERINKKYKVNIGMYD